MIQHSIRSDLKNGFLLPYHAAIEVRIGPDATGRRLFLPGLEAEHVTGTPARGGDATDSTRSAGWWRRLAMWMNPTN